MWFCTTYTGWSTVISTTSATFIIAFCWATTFTGCITAQTTIMIACKTKSWLNSITAFKSNFTWVIHTSPSSHYIGSYSLAIFPTLTCTTSWTCTSTHSFTSKETSSFTWTNSIWLLPIRNTVNTRLFGAYKSEKIIFDLSHYAKSRPAWKTGGFFAWIDGKEAQK